MIEEQLNILINDYSNHLKETKFGSEQRNLSTKKFVKIKSFVETNKLHEFNLNELTPFTIKFLNERSLKIKFKKQESKRNPKSVIHEFLQETSKRNIEKHIISQYRNNEVNPLSLIIAIEQLINERLSLTKYEMKKVGLKNKGFCSFKNELYMNLLEHFNLTKNPLYEFISEKEASYDKVEKAFLYIQSFMAETKLNTKDFLTSLSDHKITRIRIQFII